MLKNKILVIVICLLTIAAGSLIYSQLQYSLQDENIPAFSGEYKIGTDYFSKPGFYLAYPEDVEPESLIIIYPGGMVDPDCYLWAAEVLASHGHLAAVASMPLNLSMLSPNKAGAIMDNLLKQGYKWDKVIIGGHSLGGVMAARFADKNAVDGLFLWASYPASDISDRALPVLTVYASRDGLITVDKINDKMALLPEDATVVQIEGGNHSNFGRYGLQRGDLEAAISREEQERQIIDALLSFLDNEVH